MITINSIFKVYGLINKLDETGPSSRFGKIRFATIMYAQPLQEIKSVIILTDTVKVVKTV